MFSLQRNVLIPKFINILFEREKIEEFLHKINFPEIQKTTINTWIDEIEEKHALILSYSGESTDRMAAETILACEDIENIAERIKNIIFPGDFLKAHQIYKLLSQQTNALKSQIQDCLTIDPFVLQTSFSRTQKLLATQSVVARESAQYASALREHLLDIRQLFDPQSSREVSAQGPTCFISYAWPLYKYKENEEHVQAFLRILHEHLQLAGIRVILDILDNSVGNSTHVFMQQAKSSDYVILILTQSLKDKHNDPRSRALHSELQLIRGKHDADIALFGRDFSRLFPVVVSGELGLSNPPYLQMYSNVKDWREYHYLEDLKYFLHWIYIATSSRKANNTVIDEKYESLWAEFNDRNPMPVFLTDAEVQKELSLEYHAKLMQVIKNRQTYNELANERGESYFDLALQNDPMVTINSASDAYFVAETRAKLDPVDGQEHVASELELYIPPFGRDPMTASQATPTKRLLTFVRDFFASQEKVLLLQGPAGCGKTIFAYHVAHMLNTNQNGDLQLALDAIVILIALPSLLDSTHDVFREYFSQKYGEDAEREMKKLKSIDHVYFIFEAYDEIDAFQKDISQVKNLYTTNKMSEWPKAKFVFTCRSDFLHKMTEKFSETSYRKFFAPVVADKIRLDLLAEVQVAEFVPEQINDYIDEYVRLGRHCLPPHKNNAWNAHMYKQKIQELPNIKEIVKNPLYLKMTIEALPIISEWHEARMKDSKERFLKITERDVFLAYLKVNILRQEAKILQTVALSFSIENFRSKCINFLVRLCREMVKNQVFKVPYRFQRTEREVMRMNQGAAWATQFFGDPYLKQDKEQLEILEMLRHNLTCFLAYEKGVWGFIHDAFRDHFDDLNISELLHLKTQFEQSMDEKSAAAEAVDKFSSILFDEALGPYYITKQNEWASARVEYSLPAVTSLAEAFFSNPENNIATKLIEASGDDNVSCDFSYQNLVIRAVKDNLHLLQDNNGNTALHLAIQAFQLEKIKTLLQAIKDLGKTAVAILSIENN